MVVAPTTLPNTKDNTQPILVILDGSNYQAWSQNMSRWLKGHYLWEYVFGEEPKPIVWKRGTQYGFLYQPPHMEKYPLQDYLLVLQHLRRLHQHDLWQY